MTRRRWIADEVDLPHHRAALTDANAAHLARVLRAKIGQEFDIALPGNNTLVRRGSVTFISAERVEFSLGEEVPAAQSTTVEVTLLLAIFKFDRMEWAIEKATELAVSKIIPVIARRTEKHFAVAAEKRSERWQRIAREAAQQSRRTAPPEISRPDKLPSALKTLHGTRILLAESESHQALADILASVDRSAPMTLAVGPEGGWAEEELKLFADSGWEPASLGPTILRAETAAIAALAITMSLLDS